MEHSVDFGRGCGLAEGKMERSGDCNLCTWICMGP